MEKGFVYHYVELAPTEQIGAHSQQSWELSAVLVGRGERLIGDNREGFSAGDVVLVPPGINHCWYFNPDTKNQDGHIVNVSLMFMSEMVKKLSEAFPVLKSQYDYLLAQNETRVFNKNVSSRLIELLVSMQYLTDQNKIPSIVSILSLLANNIDHSKTITNNLQPDLSQQRLKQIEIFVSCNYSHHIGIGDLAKHVGMNKSAFCAFFKRATGKTFVTYLNEYRLDQVKYFLSSGANESISQIAYSCGFQTIAHFNHLFLDRYGCSPRSYLRHLSSSRL